MKINLNPTLRITLGLLSLAVTLLLLFDLLLGVFPDEANQQASARKLVAEGIAVQIATLMVRNDQATLNVVVPELLRREPALRSIGVRDGDGTLRFATPDHARIWQQGHESDVGRDRFIVPLASSARGGQAWGQVEVAFTPLPGSGPLAGFFSPAVRLVLLFSASGGLIYYLYLRRTLQHLDPTTAVPERVQMAFDAMSEAVLVLNAQGRVVMANKGFDKLMPDEGEQVIGRDPASFEWLQLGTEHVTRTLPWEQCMQEKSSVEGFVFEARTKNDEVRRLIVNSSPVLDMKDVVRGCMVSFNDVTDLDEANKQLVSLMADLSASKEQLEVQNVELQRLANVDPMTGARNRRSFFPEFERMFLEARQRGLALSFIMSDIDKFKSVNDVYGHQIGDKVIQKFASILLRSARESDVVCRYGGEEFCIALPGTDAQQAHAVAERIREQVEAEVGPSLPLDTKPVITASFGVASVSGGAPSAEALADQADQALYHSKHSGRNRCTTYSKVISGKQSEDDAKKSSSAA